MESTNGSNACFCVSLRSLVYVMFCFVYPRPPVNVECAVANPGLDSVVPSTLKVVEFM